MWWRIVPILTAAFSFLQASTQPDACKFQPPFYKMHFGRGEVRDVNASTPAIYQRVSSTCPGDGYYTYASFSSDCFSGDWHTLTEDHTPGDVSGNMLLVNSAFEEGLFLSTSVKGFKPNTVYQFGVWLMNLCRPTRKCPFPLLPNLLIQLQTPDGKTVARFTTGELVRVEQPKWAEHKARFTTPAGQPELLLTFVNTAPGGCGNDFAMDDISFSECMKPVVVKTVLNTKPPSEKPKRSTVLKTPPANPQGVATPRKRSSIVTVARTEKTPIQASTIPLRPKEKTLNLPDVLRLRTNKLVQRIESPAGEVQLDLYDNGEIDGDTVSIYHNGQLIASQQRLSQKPISFRVQLSKEQALHEFVMVANNLGSIPPNTSLMMVTAAGKRHQVYISSTEQQNAKLIIALKE